MHLKKIIHICIYFTMLWQTGFTVNSTVLYNNSSANSPYLGFYIIRIFICDIRESSYVILAYFSKFGLGNIAQRPWGYFGYRSALVHHLSTSSNSWHSYICRKIPLTQGKKSIYLCINTFYIHANFILFITASFILRFF